MKNIFSSLGFWARTAVFMLIASIAFIAISFASPAEGPNNDSAQLKKFYEYVFGLTANESPDFSIDGNGTQVGDKIGHAVIGDNAVESNNIKNKTIIGGDIANKTIAPINLTGCSADQVLVFDSEGDAVCTATSSIGIQSISVSNGILGNGEENPLTVDFGAVQKILTLDATCTQNNTFINAINSDTGVASCATFTEQDGDATNELQGVTEDGGLEIDSDKNFKMKSCTDEGEILKWNGSKWTCGSDIDTKISDQDVTDWGYIKEGGTVTEYDPKLFERNLDKITVTEQGNIGIGTNSLSDLTRATIAHPTDSRFEVRSDTPGEAMVRIISNNLRYGYIDAMDKTATTPKDLVFQANGGNVGIGTTTPSQRLDVAGKIRSQSTVAGDDAQIVTTKDYVQGLITNAEVWEKAEDGDISYDNGKVGIGTKTPTSTLQVTGDWATIALTNGNGSHSVHTQINPTTGIYYDFYTPDEGITNTIFTYFDPATNNLSFNAGNVGIGTTTPADKLEIVMNGSGNQDGLSIKAVNSFGAGSQPGVQFNKPDGTKIYSVASDVDSDMLLITNRDNQVIMTGLQNGNVGIGTITPKEKLDVNGNLVANNFALSRDNVTRGTLFLATTGDFNHALYNNYSNIDGKGQWDGANWNVHSGLRIQTGNVDSTLKTALSLSEAGNLGVIGKISSQSTLKTDGENTVTTKDYVDAKVFESITGVTESDPQIASRNLDKITVTSDGKVGIGTNSPSTKIEIVGDNPYVFTNQDQSGFIADAASLKRVGLMKYSGKEGGIWRVQNQDFEIGRISGTDLTGDPGIFTTDLYVSGTGNVGIGTTTPSTKLHIIAGSGSASAIKFCDVTGDSQCAELVAGSSYYGFRNNSNRLDLSISQATGNVGIGTTTPSAKLTISGGRVPLVINGDQSDLTGMTINNSTVGETGWSLYMSGQDGFGGSESGDFVIDEGGNSGGSVGGARMTIKNNTGNVGIGTTTPTTRLHVKGGSGIMIEGGISNAPFNILQYGTSASDNHIRIGTDTGHYSDAALEIYQSNTDNNSVAPGYSIFNGKVGIGTNNIQNVASEPSEALEVAGNVKATAFLQSSDKRLKTDIKTLDEANDILKLRGVQFTWKQSGIKDIGFIAQEVEEIFPELVSTGNDDMKAVKYANMTALLLEVVKDQDNKIAELENQNKTILERLERLEKGE